MSDSSSVSNHSINTINNTSIDSFAKLIKFPSSMNNRVKDHYASVKHLFILSCVIDYVTKAHSSVG